MIRCLSPFRQIYRQAMNTRLLMKRNRTKEEIKQKGEHGDNNNNKNNNSNIGVYDWNLDTAILTFKKLNIQ